jgi:hypothetical protein
MLILKGGGGYFLYHNNLAVDFKEVEIEEKVSYHVLILISKEFVLPIS